MPRKSKEAGPLTIGFFGVGEMPTDKIISELLDEYLIGKGYATVNAKDEIEFGDVTFLIPATKERYTDAMAAVVAYAQESDLPYEVVHDEVSAKARPIAAAIKGASKVHKVARIGSKLAGELTKRDNALLVAIWEDGDEELAKVVTAAKEAETPIRDLTMDMEEVDVTDADDAPAEDAEKAPEAEADDGAPDDHDANEEPYTEEELSGFELSDLKAFCMENKVDVPERSRKPTYVKLILEAQEKWAAEADIATGGDTAERTTTLLEAKGIDPEEIATAVLEALFGKDGPLEWLDDSLSDLARLLADVQAEQKELRQAIVDVHHSLNGAKTSSAPAEAEDDAPEEKAPVRRTLRRRAL